MPMQLFDAVKQIESFGLDAKVSLRHCEEADLEFGFVDLIATVPIAFPGLRSSAGRCVAIFSLLDNKIVPNSESVAERITSGLNLIKRNAAHAA